MSKNIKLKHINLNKLIYGNNQHIFHSNVHTHIINNEKQSLKPISSHIDYFKYNTVFYSNFLDNSITDNQYELFDFDEIKFLYNQNDLTNKSYLTIKPYLTNISQYYKNYFNKNLYPTQQHPQDIFYFNNIEKPIDILNINNIVYFLSPLYSGKNLAISQQNTLFQNYNTQIAATNKNHYQQMMKYLINRNVSYTENNNIPIYDLGFNFIDTISFSSYFEINEWINKYKFNEISSNITFIDTNTNYYSINIQKILKELALNQNYQYLYSNNDILDILTELISKIKTNESVNKYIDRYGIISKLNKNNLKTILKEKTLSSIFHLNKEDIKNKFNKSFKDSFTVNDIPQNTLYFSNINKTVKNKSEIYQKLSTDISFVNLKNQQDPDYNYDVTLPSALYDIILYEEDFHYVTIDNNNNINKKFNGNKIKVQLLSAGTYFINYYNGTFYYQVPILETYDNTFIYSFLSATYFDNNDIKSNISGELIALTGKYNKSSSPCAYTDYYSTASSMISSHVMQAIYKKCSLSASYLTFLNQQLETFKIFGIDWTIPPSGYRYSFEGIENDLTPNYNGSFITSSSQEEILNQNALLKIYYPSKTAHIDVYQTVETNGIISSILITDNLLSSSNDFDQKYHRQKQVNATCTVSANNFYLDFYFSNKYKLYGNVTFKYYLSTQFYGIEKNIDNYSRMMLFDNDKTKNQAYYYTNYAKLNNQYFLNPNKNIASSILSSSSIKDIQYALEDEDYKNNNPQRLYTKLKKYLNQYNELHTEVNRMPEVGTINGNRIYEHIGKSNDSQFWISYKYITTQSNSLLNSLATSKTLPFSVYNLNRFSQNMELNELGNIDYKGINDIRAMNNNISKYPYVFFDNYKNTYLCSSCFHCQLPKNKQCNCGYCTFPYNNTLFNTTYGNYPNTKLWNKTQYNKIKNISLNSNTIFQDQISLYLLQTSQEFKQNIYTKTDLNINDDLEIYYISNKITNNDIKTLFNNIKIQPYTFTSIFQGFGGLRETNGKQVKYKDYLMINNSENTYENKYIYKTIKNSFNELYEYIPKNIEQSNEQFSLIFKQKKLSSVIYDFCNLKENQYFINEFLEHENLTNQENNLINTQITSLIANTEFSFILSTSINLLNEYAQNKKIPNYPQFSYKEIATKSLYDILLSNSYYKNILTNFHQKQELEDTYILNNGFVISKYSPFNGPHKIKADTQLYGLLLSGNTINDIETNLTKNELSSFTNIKTIPSGYNVLLRVNNWWSDKIKCTGSIIIKPDKISIEQTNNLSQVNQIVNQFDFIEAINDTNFLRLNQNEYSKSNIYSVKIKNSGLNPENILFNDIKQAIILKDYGNLNSTQQQLYIHVSFDEIETDLSLSSSINITQHYDNMLYISENSDNIFLQQYKPDKEKLYENQIQLKEYYRISNGYWKLNTERINKIETLKTDLRNNLETAIKTSMTRYMPAETKIWKIIYEGK